MTALAAAVAFGLSLIFQLFSVGIPILTPNVLNTLGFLLVALHLAGIGTARRSYRRRR